MIFVLAPQTFPGDQQERWMSPGITQVQDETVIASTAPPNISLVNGTVCPFLMHHLVMVQPNLDEASG